MLIKIRYLLVVVGVLSSYSFQSPLRSPPCPDQDELPRLKLPYGTWRAQSYEPVADIYTFKNIRFAAPPLGNLRWEKPAPPNRETIIQDGSYGPICTQDDPFFEMIAAAEPKNGSEDCLFLDLYVPGKAIRDPSLRLPVISWFYGGSYHYGGKDSYLPFLPYYNGTGLLQESGGNVIFVASNYRVGAYGFLAGTTMEREGVPNAGFYDQRAALQWIQDHISLVGGDPSQVSAWGESAGAGSIMHHLISFGGKQDPLFKRAVLLSPGYLPLYDRRGSVEQTFRSFASLAGCPGQGVACLRAAPAAQLRLANRELLQAGTLFQPVPDGHLIRQAAPLEFASGNFYKHVEALILSHVEEEAEPFVPDPIVTNEDFTGLVNSILPSYVRESGIIDAIEARYPAPSEAYPTNRDRAKAIVGEQLFYCNIRYLSDAYASSGQGSYNLIYAYPPALHATDQVPAFYNPDVDVEATGQVLGFPLVSGFERFAQAYQSYLTSYSRSGDPNKYRRRSNLTSTVQWGKVGNSGTEDVLTGVLKAGNLSFEVVDDLQTRRSVCDLWEDVTAAVTNLGGYAPPGSVVPTTLVNVTNDPSANYTS